MKQFDESSPLFIQKLDKLCKDVSFGQITVEKFSEEVSGYKKNLTEAFNNIQKEEMSEELRSVMNEEIKAGSCGLSLFINGLEKLEEYVTTKNLPLLEEGLALCISGNEMLFKAMELNLQRMEFFKNSGDMNISNP